MVKKLKINHVPDSLANLTRVLSDSFSPVITIPCLPKREYSVAAVISIDVPTFPSKMFYNRSVNSGPGILEISMHNMISFAYIIKWNWKMRLELNQLDLGANMLKKALYNLFYGLCAFFLFLSLPSPGKIIQSEMIPLIFPVVDLMVC